MMQNDVWFLLQLFGGEGAGGSGGSAGGEGGGTDSGENAAAAGQQRLRELGVPENRIRKNRVYQMTPKTEQKATAEASGNQKEQAAAADNPTEEKKTDAPARMSWDEIMADPEYNKQMQSVVQFRLKNAKTAEETLSKIAPVIEVVARKYGQDPANVDYDALVKSVNDDDAYYEDKALEMGVSVATAKQIDQQERDTARQQRTLEQQKIQQHIMKLEQQAEEMKKVFPNFDLRTELQNPAFVRMTSPNVGVSVEDAYYAIHRKEIQFASMQVAAQKTAEKVSKSIQAGSRRPNENGTSGQAPSVTTFDYRTASREQREAFKKRIRSGEKIYPGQM